ncbi:MAG: GDP-L-fucose synthase, partial [Candidatus Marinimicrobia bacterium]|nr:GDP-L-fucose synthase [Candidatus Neomarinimicrobiota bacterium]
AVGFKGAIRFNPAMPDGTPRKLLDVSRMDGLGWHAEIELQEGISNTYSWFLKHQDSFRH